MAYRVAMPLALSEVHNVFHVSMLLKSISNPANVLSYENMELDQYLSYEEKSVQILE